METNANLFPHDIITLRPHSLGKLIEWKLNQVTPKPTEVNRVPTRWGN